jgi:hypothetical protein
MDRSGANQWSSMHARGRFLSSYLALEMSLFSTAARAGESLAARGE